jgi:hypothetical protein
LIVGRLNPVEDWALPVPWLPLQIGDILRLADQLGQELAAPVGVRKLGLWGPRWLFSITRIISNLGSQLLSTLRQQ